MKKTMRLDHRQLNSYQMVFDLPGGIKGCSDFQQYYIREAAKAFMGLESDFTVGKSKSRVMNEIIPILKDFDILIDEDIFYDTFKKFTSIRSKHSENEVFESKTFKEALSLVEQANHLLDGLDEELTPTIDIEPKKNVDALTEIKNILEKSNLSPEWLAENIK